jgi:hypothetical protein
MSGPFDLEIQNIKTNLIDLIKKYTTISKNFEKTIAQQNEKLNNNIQLIDNNYNDNLNRYEFMKSYQSIILNDINEIKTNLVTLERLVLYTDELAVQYFEILDNRNNNELVNEFNNSNLNTGGKKTKKHLRSRRVRKRKSMKQKKT